MTSCPRIFAKILLASTTLLLLATQQTYGSETEMQSISHSARSSLLEADILAAEIVTLQASLQPDGSWPDVDYASKAVTQWPPSTHLTRLRDLARAYAKPGNPFEGDPGLLADALSAFDAWIARDPRSDNWWYNEINTPQKIGETMLLLEPHLSSGQLTAGLSIISRAYVPRSTNSGTNTGANRTDRAYAGILRGLLAANESLLSESYLAIGDTILVATTEGVQPDFSYQQHGAQLHIQGYGVVYASGVLRYGKWAAGTSFGFTPFQRRVLVDFLIDGVQWFIRGDTLDFTAAGRSLTRSGQASTGVAFLSPVNDAITVGGGYRLGELETFAMRLDNDGQASASDTATALSGHRHFWRSDSTVYHRPSFSVFLKTSSTRTKQPETGNGEGLKNLHLADGVTLIQRSGNEYDNVMPVWDWRTLPGTTTEQGSYSLKPSSDWGVAGNSTHAGGVSDGHAGATAFAYNRLGVSGKKSWFFLGDRMVALGADINAPAASNPVVTTLNQCLLDGPITYSSSSGSPIELTFERENVSTLNWVHHGGLGYFFPQGSGSATIVGESRTGTWSSINSSQSSTPVTEEVFALHLNHGSQVSGGNYSYVVIPVDDATSMPVQFPDDLVIERNDPIAQAVSDPPSGYTAVNFWAAGTVAGITSDTACSLLLRSDSDHLEITVADPSQTKSQVMIEIDREVAGTLHADTGIVVESESPSLRMRVDLSGTQGRSKQARFFIRPHAYQMITLPSVADGFVYDRNPDAVYGSDETAIVKLVNSPDWNRLAYFRFDLSSLPGPPESASLKLSTINTQNPGLHGVHLLSPGNWDESSLTWNTRPEPIGPPIALWLPKIGQRISVGMNDLISTNTLELTIAPLTRTTDGVTVYGTRENSNPTLRPVLEVMIARTELEIWRLEKFGEDAGNLAISGDEADPDGDGLMNAIEFVLGTAPDSDSSAQRPEGWTDGDRYVFSFRRSHFSSEEDVFVEASTDLESWDRLEDGTDGVLFKISPEPGESGVDRVKVSLPLAEAGANHRFLRVGITR